MRAVGPLDKRKTVTRCQACAKRRIKVGSLIPFHFSSRKIDNICINSVKEGFLAIIVIVPTEHVAHKRRLHQPISAGSSSHMRHANKERQLLSHYQFKSNLMIAIYI